MAAAAIVVAVVLTRGGNGGSIPGDAPKQAPAGSLRVPFVYSPEKERLLAPLIARYNAEGRRVGGKRVFVEAKIVSSGDATKQIAQGQLKPAAWSPASSFWGRLLDQRTDSALAAPDNPSIVRTPLVLAMFKPLAQALGWPRRPVGFKQIVKLATARDGWASVGRPNFGRFKYVHTNPDFSTSGAEAVTSAYYAFAGKREGLTEADVARVAPRVKALEGSIEHYGDNTLFIEQQLREHGLSYASAVAMEETTLLDFNRRQGPGPKLVAIYPSEGTFVSDNPFIALHAGWVSRPAADGARDFGRFLARRVTPGLAAASGFRPPGRAARSGPEISPAAGADPAQPKIELTVPEPPVLDRVITTWRRDRKPANVLLVLDNSGSMSEDNKLEQAKQGLRTFLAQAAPQDRIGLSVFSHTTRSLVPIGPFAKNGARLRAALDQIVPEDDTALNQATLDGLNTVKRSSDPSRIAAVVLLTDGMNTVTGASTDQVTARLAQEGRAETGGVRVYTIAYGADADAGLLGRFAQASGGKPFVGNTSNIDSVYLSISSFF